MSKRRKLAQQKSEARLQQQNRYIRLGMYAVLAFVIFVIYGKTSDYDFAIDDKIMIVENEYVNKGLSGYGALLEAGLKGDTSVPGVTRPVLMFSHGLDVSLFGLNAGPQHVVNVILYILLVFLLMHLLRKHLLPDESQIIPFLIVLLFIAHPVHVESVANVKGRDDVMCFIFGALSVLFFFKHFEGRKYLYLTLSLLCLVLSFFTKETGIGFAIMVPLTYYYCREVSVVKTIRITYPYLLVALVLVLIRLVLFSDHSGQINIYNNSLLAIDDPVQRTAMTFRIMLHYIQLTLWPDPLSWDYSLGHFEMTDQTMILAAVSFVVYAGLVVLVILKLQRKSMIIYGLVFSLVMLIPVSNIVITIAATFGERLLFMPIFGFAIAFVLTIKALYEMLADKLNIRNKYPMYFLIFIVSGIFMVLSSSRTEAWENEEVLIENDFEYANTLRSSRAYIQQLTALPNDKPSNHNKAMEICNAGLSRFDQDWQLWYFKGVIHNYFKRSNEAKEAFRNSISYNGENFYALANYGHLIANENPDEAIEVYQRAISIKGDDVRILGNLGILLHKKGDYDGAKAYYERALNINPNNQNIRNAYNILLAN